MKKGFLIIGINLTLIAAASAVLSNSFVINVMVERNANGNISEQIGSIFDIIFSIVISIPSYIGQLIFSAAAIGTTVNTLRSESHGIKLTGIIFIIINVVLLIISIVIFVTFIITTTTANTEASFIINSLRF